MMPKFSNVVVQDTGLKSIGKIMIEKGKNKSSFWKPVAMALFKKESKNLAIGNLDYDIKKAKSFSGFRKRISAKASGYSYFPPVSQSYELYGRKLTKLLAKKLKVKVSEY